MELKSRVFHFGEYMGDEQVGRGGGHGHLLEMLQQPLGARPKACNPPGTDNSVLLTALFLPLLFNFLKYTYIQQGDPEREREQE